MKEIDRARIVVETGGVSISTITKIYAGGRVREMQRHLVERAARKLGLPLPPPPKTDAAPTGEPTAALPAVVVSLIAARLSLRLRPRGGALLSTAETETAGPRQGRPRRNRMSQSKVSHPQSQGNVLGGITVNQIHPDPLLVSDLDVIARGFSKERARGLLRAAGGYSEGHRILIGRDKFLAYLDTHGKTLAAPEPKKKPTTAKMTAVQIAEAAGLRMVRK